MMQEHLRRHTGETPFSCTDCPLRFKTRNTYKRHLKTRHGKLLTAHGICSLPYDEYMKVCTRPYAQTRPVEDIKDDADVDDSKDELSETKVNDIEMPASNKLLELCSQAISQASWWPNKMFRRCYRLSSNPSILPCPSFS